MGTYQLVFPTYNMLLTISSAGLPVAISRMVSFTLARDDPRNARRIFRVALCLLSTLGLIATLLMLVMSPTARPPLGRPLHPAGLCGHCAGPFAGMRHVRAARLHARAAKQGAHRHFPADRAGGKVFVALPLAYFGMRVSVAYAAAGVLLGTSSPRAWRFCTCL